MIFFYPKHVLKASK